MSRVAQYRILCVGDNEYVDKLQQLLGTQYQVDSKDVKGETTIQLRERIIASRFMHKLKVYDLICIQGGGNELVSQSATAICLRLQQIHKYCLNANSNVQTVVMAIPETETEAEFKHISKTRLAVNNELQQFVNNDFTGRMHYFDLTPQILLNRWSIKLTDHDHLALCILPMIQQILK